MLGVPQHLPGTDFKVVAVPDSDDTAVAGGKPGLSIVQPLTLSPVCLCLLQYVPVPQQWRATGLDDEVHLEELELPPGVKRWT